MIQVGVREFIKDFNKLQDENIVEIIDKKTNTLKGMYISKKEALRIKDILKEAQKKENEERLKRIMQFAGSMEVDEKFKDLSKEELREAVARAKAKI